MTISHGSILAVFFSASQAEIQQGRAWYNQANLVCRTIAKSYQIKDGYHLVAGVVAALSPNNRWSRNVSDAEALIKAYTLGSELDAIKVSTFHKNKEKAIKILKGENPLDVLGGQKVRAFYKCIIGTQAVCVDGHAFAIWSGQRIPTSRTPKISDKLYNQISADYTTAAEVINNITGECYTPAQVQAITWVTWRNLFNGAHK